jgi:hypothetical protein
MVVRAVQWRLFPRFLFGSALGMMGFGVLFVNLPSRYPSLAIGSYTLLSLWSTKFDQLIRRYETFFSAGFSQTGLGLIVSATGPLTHTLI